MKITAIIVILLFLSSIVVYSLYNSSKDEIFVGWRSSEYGYQQEQQPSYWVEFSNEMSSKIQGSIASGIWILGSRDGERDCNLNFPGNFEYHNIAFSQDDMSEEYLTVFDRNNLKVWLQVEPADADVETLIRLVLDRYSNHDSVIGFGIDVEWLNSADNFEGRLVTESEVSEWLHLIKTYKPEYKLFLKHWDYEKLPSNYPEDVVFICDSQGFESYHEMLEEFRKWGEHFSDAEVAFQFGYEADRKIWEQFEESASKIGNDILETVPNTVGLYWVDFTITEIFKVKN
ncbi:MAG: hypothetical protein JW700_03925 [Candidatus Aenigmarchaeota archaeon]|nr:hypothetical protein [Candidatus Aenigmarchaeota archaeon]